MILILILIAISLIFIAFLTHLYLYISSLKLEIKNLNYGIKRTNEIHHAQVKKLATDFKNAFFGEGYNDYLVDIKTNDGAIVNTIVENVERIYHCPINNFTNFYGFGDVCLYSVKTDSIMCIKNKSQ